MARSNLNGPDGLVPLDHVDIPSRAGLAGKPPVQGDAIRRTGDRCEGVPHDGRTGGRSGHGPGRTDRPSTVIASGSGGSPVDPTLLGTKGEVGTAYDRDEPGAARGGKRPAVGGSGADRGHGDATGRRKADELGSTGATVDDAIGPNAERPGGLPDGFCGRDAVRIVRVLRPFGLTIYGKAYDAPVLAAARARGESRIHVAMDHSNPDRVFAHVLGRWHPLHTIVTGNGSGAPTHGRAPADAARMPSIPGPDHPAGAVEAPALVGRPARSKAAPDRDAPVREFDGLSVAIVATVPGLDAGDALLSFARRARPGEILALVGGSGTGKTTVLDAFMARRLTVGRARAVEHLARCQAGRDLPGRIRTLLPVDRALEPWARRPDIVLLDDVSLRAKRDPIATLSRAARQAERAGVALVLCGACAEFEAAAKRYAKTRRGVEVISMRLLAEAEVVEAAIGMHPGLFDGAPADKARDALGDLATACGGRIGSLRGMMRHGAMLARSRRERLSPLHLVATCERFRNRAGPR